MAGTADTAGETIDTAEILRRLPHRYPFLLVDRAVAYVPF
jgi:3-hydroxyacyl-[acyl-carrier-protein] dehydratase